MVMLCNFRVFQLSLPVSSPLPSSSTHSLTLDPVVSVAHMLAASVRGPPYRSVRETTLSWTWMQALGEIHLC